MRKRKGSETYDPAKAGSNGTKRKKMKLKQVPAEEVYSPQTSMESGQELYSIEMPEMIAEISVTKEEQKYDSIEGLLKHLQK